MHMEGAYRKLNQMTLTLKNRAKVPRRCMRATLSLIRKFVRRSILSAFEITITMGDAHPKVVRHMCFHFSKSENKVIMSCRSSFLKALSQGSRSQGPDDRRPCIEVRMRLLTVKIEYPSICLPL